MILSTDWLQTPVIGNEREGGELGALLLPSS